jgi:hypothetical protein
MLADFAMMKFRNYPSCRNVNGFIGTDGVATMSSSDSTYFGGREQRRHVHRTFYWQPHARFINGIYRRHLRQCGAMQRVGWFW